MVALSNTKLYYIFGDSATSDFSREYVFIVAPAKVIERSRIEYVKLHTPSSTILKYGLSNKWNPQQSTSSNDPLFYSLIGHPAQEERNEDAPIR